VNNFNFSGDRCRLQGENTGTAPHDAPGIVQLRGAHGLPPLGPNLTPFRLANSDALNLNIAGLSRKDILITQKEKNQDISEK
jgi:hypothetical protein